MYFCSIFISVYHQCYKILQNMLAVVHRFIESLTFLYVAKVPMHSRHSFQRRSLSFCSCHNLYDKKKIVYGVSRVIS